MKVKKTQVTKYLLSNLERLDAVTVIVENFELGRGKIIIECFGKCWGYFWGTMGENTLEQFFISCDNEYLINKLSGTNILEEYEYEYLNKIVNQVKEGFRQEIKLEDKR